MDNQLTETELARIETFKKEIDFNNPELISQYGVSVQKNLSEVSEKILEDVRNKQAVEVGSLLNQMMVTVKGIDLDHLSNPGFLTRVWHKLLSEISLFKGGFEKINNQLNLIILKLESSKTQLLEDIRKLDLIYDNNLAYYQDLNLLIMAAEEAIAEKQAELLELGKQVAQDNYLVIQQLQDKKTTLQEFEKRIHDLKLTKTMTLQTLPQIRLIQHNNNELINKIQSSILNTLPIWKNQIVLTLSLEKQKKVADIQRRIQETTNNLLIKNSAFLKENTLHVAQLSEEGVLEPKSLKKMNEELINTIRDVLQIYQDGKKKRKEAELELSEMERRLKASLAI
jgi:uncharacterized protein YaaN involved in tellurite resistance